MDSCTGVWGQSGMEDGWRDASCTGVGGGGWIEKRKGENCNCNGTKGKKKDIEAQLVELMPSCNYLGTILLSLLGMMYGLCENPVSVSSDHFSQFSAGGEKYPDAIAMAMDDLNKRVWSVMHVHRKLILIPRPKKCWAWE